LRFWPLATNTPNQPPGYQSDPTEMIVQSNPTTQDQVALIPEADSAVHIEGMTCSQHDRTTDGMHR